MNNKLKTLAVLFVSLVVVDQLYCESSFSTFLSTIRTKLSGMRNVTKKDAIGVIKIGEDLTSENTQQIIEQIYDCSQASHIKGVLIEVNSGGGLIGCGELIFNEIKKLSYKKPVVALVADCALSAGYYAIASANLIVAPATAAMGAIGVRSGCEKYKNIHLHQKNYDAEVELQLVYAGKYKGMFDKHGPSFTEEEYAVAQQYADALYEELCSSIAIQRRLPLGKITEWADGKVFTGKQALEQGLIDVIGDYSDAINKVVVLAQERGNPLDHDFVIEK